MSSSAIKLCIENGGPARNGRSGTGLSLSTVLGLIVAAALAMATAGAVYYKKTQDSMRDQVRGILAEYMPLEDLDGPGTNSRGVSHSLKMSVILI
jgi:hypothetical protein